MEKERVESSLKNRLSVYGASDYYGFHMPGHKRRMGELGDPYKIDITEIYGFDDLHHPEKEGIITRAQALWCRGDTFSGKWKHGGDFKCDFRMYTFGKWFPYGEKQPP